MKLMRPLIVFDLDGTLVDTAPDILGALRYVFKRHGMKEFCAIEVLKVVGISSAAIVRAGLSNQSIKFDEPQIAQLSAELEMAYFELPTISSTMPNGSIRSLHKLKACGCALAICTNKPQRLAEKVVKELQISNMFDVLIGGDTRPYRKPDPRHLTDTILAAKSSAPCSVYVGDSHSDMVTAMSAGVLGIRYSGGYEKVTEDQLGGVHLLDSFDDLYSLVDKHLLQNLRSGTNQTQIELNSCAY